MLLASFWLKSFFATSVRPFGMAMDCTACGGELASGGNDTVNYSCGHKFHLPCLSNIAMDRKQPISNLPCPKCNPVPVKLEASEETAKAHEDTFAEFYAEELGDGKVTPMGSPGTFSEWEAALKAEGAKKLGRHDREPR